MTAPPRWGSADALMGALVGVCFVIPVIDLVRLRPTQPPDATGVNMANVSES